MSFLRALLVCVASISAAIFAAPLAAFEPSPSKAESNDEKSSEQAAQERKEKFTTWMRGFAEGTKIAEMKAGRNEQPARL